MLTEEKRKRAREGEIQPKPGKMETVVNLKKKKKVEDPDYKDNILLRQPDKSLNQVFDSSSRHLSRPKEGK